MPCPVARASTNKLNQPMVCPNCETVFEPGDNLQAASLRAPRKLQRRPRAANDDALKAKRWRMTTMRIDEIAALVRGCGKSTTTSDDDDDALAD